MKFNDKLKGRFSEIVGAGNNVPTLSKNFKTVALRNGWSEDTVDAILAEAHAGDYYHFIFTLSRYIEVPEETEETESK